MDWYKLKVVFFTVSISYLDIQDIRCLNHFFLVIRGSVSLLSFAVRLIIG